jgi:hypothetical protein
VRTKAPGDRLQDDRRQTVSLNNLAKETQEARDWAEKQAQIHKEKERVLLADVQELLLRYLSEQVIAGLGITFDPEYSGTCPKRYEQPKVTIHGKVGLVTFLMFPLHDDGSEWSLLVQAPPIGIRPAVEYQYHVSGNHLQRELLTVVEECSGMTDLG